MILLTNEPYTQRFIICSRFKFFSFFKIFYKVGFGYPSLTHRRPTIIDVPSIIKQIPFGSFQGPYKTPTPFLNPLSMAPLSFDNDLLRLTIAIPFSFCLTLYLSPRKRFLACPTPLLTFQVFLPCVQINGNLLILHSLRTISIPYNTKLTPLDFSLPFPLPHGSRVRGIVLKPPKPTSPISFYIKGYLHFSYITRHFF